MALLLSARSSSLPRSAVPAGNWQSVTSERYTNPLHPVLSGAEFYLKIDVSNDGSFRGECSKYFCAIGPLGLGERDSRCCDGRGKERQELKRSFHSASRRGDTAISHLLGPFNSHPLHRCDDAASHDMS